LESLQSDIYEEYLEFYKAESMSFEKDVHSENGLLQNGLKMVRELNEKVIPAYAELDEVNLNP
jgi:hypothetical protein